ncbi:MAG: hypothetical protein AB1638_04255 [Nitrospirota bacterium]
MNNKKSEKLLQKTYRFFPFLISLLFTIHYSLTAAQMMDCVVAFVDDTAITLSELEETFTKTQKVSADISKAEILNTMINRILILRETKRIGLEAPSEDELVKEYIDLKIRPLIRIREKDLSDFYKEHVKDFQGKEFEAVREEIENFLTEKELNRQLKIHLEELRKRAYVKILIKD